MEYLAIWGATSSIAENVARKFASRNARLVLVARNLEKLEKLKSRLQADGASSVRTYFFDAHHPENHASLVTEIRKENGAWSTVLIAHGHLPDQKHCESSFPAAALSFTENFLSPVAIAEPIVADMEKENSGTLCVISSVAGDKGRRKNYFYCAAKSALSTYLEGLRNRLGKTNISVVTIKPGLTISPMTEHLKKTLLFSSSEKVASVIDTAIRSKKENVYAPGYWRMILWILRSLPESLFKRTNL